VQHVTDLAPTDPANAVCQQTLAININSGSADDVNVSEWLTCSTGPAAQLHVKDASGSTSVAGGVVLLGDEEEEVDCLDDWLEEVSHTHRVGSRRSRTSRHGSLVPNQLAKAQHAAQDCQSSQNRVLYVHVYFLPCCLIIWLPQRSSTWPSGV
jgi:hypothetical protein